MPRIRIFRLFKFASNPIGETSNVITKNFFNSSVVDEWLPSIVASYVEHAGMRGRFVGLKRVFKTHIIVFKRCMGLSNNFSFALLTSCSFTTLLCTGVFIPGPQQAVVLPMCQTLMLLVEELEE
jgi:hypothetical protein